jgi:uncharacterized protein (DUF2235 family)
MPRKGGFRHLVYFIDGTWLWAGSGRALDVYSNIYLLNMLLNADDGDGHAQIKHYARGLGGVDGIRKYTSGGFAYGIDELVADLYVNICSNYEPGDKLYIFGFSRGAVVARALSGLLSKGILKREDVNMFAHVWADYVGLREIALSGLPKEYPRGPAVKYEDKLSEPNPTIEFLGVFDTVAGGHGIAEVTQKLRLNQRRVGANVKNAVQLLAIDETRSFFRPIMWTGTGNQGEGKTTHLEQIWIPGVHSDVGGAYRDRSLGNISLLTMIDRVIKKTSLNFDLKLCAEYNKKLSPGQVTHIHNEYTKLWKLVCPIQQRRRTDRDIQQYIHPFALQQGLAVRYKRSKRHTGYSLPHEFKRLPVAKEFISGTFDSFLDST